MQIVNFGRRTVYLLRSLWSWSVVSSNSRRGQFELPLSSRPVPTDSRRRRYSLRQNSGQGGGGVSASLRFLTSALFTSTHLHLHSSPPPSSLSSLSPPSPYSPSCSLISACPDRLSTTSAHRTECTRSGHLTRRWTPLCPLFWPDSTPASRVADESA